MIILHFFNGNNKFFSSIFTENPPLMKIYDIMSHAAPLHTLGLWRHRKNTFSKTQVKL